MTAKEKKAYEEWSKKMSAQGDARDTHFEDMRRLYEECGGGKAPCALDGCLNYLLTSNDERTRQRALTVYRKYYEADAQYMALLELGQALADAQELAGNEGTHHEQT